MLLAAALVAVTALSLTLACALLVRSLREGLLLAAVVGSVLLVAVTELLSTLDAVRPVPLGLLWLAVAAGGATVTWRRRDELTALRRRVGSSWRSGWALLLAALAAAPALTALVVAPNNWDSMTYHLSRVAHWRAQGSVDFYATVNDRQLWSTPLAELGMLHLAVLGHGDRLVTLVQWAALVVSAVGVSVVCRRLGLGGRAQVVSAVLVVTTPMAVLQASSTQNDLVTGALVVVSVAWLLRLRDGATGRLDVLVTGAALGSAFMAKPTAAVFVLPFALWWLVVAVRRSPRAAARSVVGIAVVAILVVAPHAVRTTATYRNPLGPGAEATANAGPGVAATVENVVRNLGLNLAVPVTPVNTAVTDGIGSALSAVGLDVADPGSTFAGSTFGVMFSIHEDYTGDLALLGLLVLSLVAVLAVRSLRARLLTFSGCLVAAFVLFCALFSWQPWGNRLMVPLFLLATVPVAGALAAVRRPLSTAVVALVAVASVPWLVNPALRSALTGPGRGDREAQYFFHRPELLQPYRQAADQLRSLGVTDVGLVQGGDSWEYPLWALTDDDRPAVTFRELQVTGAAARLQSRSVPQAIVCTVACMPPSGWTVRDLGQGVRVAWPAVA